MFGSCSHAQKPVCGRHGHATFPVPAASRKTSPVVASIGMIASPSQGASYFAKDGYYARDDPAHKEASAWADRGVAELGLSGPVDSDTFKAILEGRVPDGPHLGKRGKDGEIKHRLGRDVTMSAPKSVSLMAMVGGDERIVEAHDRAVRTTLG